MKKRWAKRIPFVIGIAALAITVMSGAVMLLWNGIIAGVFHIGMITFWQAMGILALCKILFGGFRGGGPGKWRMRRHMYMRWQATRQDGGQCSMA